jgi:cation diffusion facilitator CzcD-associated flavoprotein CzcO
MSDTNTHFDVLIVGAGLSGIGAAWHLRDQCPAKTFALLESRADLGGTWDLFRYPGIRSDSDMYTLGYSFRPWTQPKAIADGPSILEYIRETAREGGIDAHIHFKHRVEGARWSSGEARWTLDVRDLARDVVQQWTCSFLMVCAGYYDYDEAHAPEFEGRQRFQGRIIHPQYWPEDLDYDQKRVVVIGSGATAMTLVPALAKRAAHVTMLQRSPTYVIARPARDALADWMNARLPTTMAYSLTRLKNIAMGTAFYSFCRRYPAQARRFLVGEVRKALGRDYDVGVHFNPRYNPWDQRLCLVPEGDLFDVLREGRASVVTDEIACFTERGVRTRSGAEIEADIIVTATGLKLKFLGGIGVEVDGRRVEFSKTFAYKGLMFSDVPNLAVAIGYTNASWTLKCDLSCEYVCRLLRHMDAQGYAWCYPHNDDPALREAPLLDITANYVLRALGQFPKQGTLAPWRVYQNYVLDRLALRRSDVNDGVMRFVRRGEG